MSVALSKALSSGNLAVRKAASGEVIIVFRNPVLKTDAEGNKISVNVNPVRIAHSNPINLYSRKNIDRAAVDQSNLKSLVQMGAIEVV